ncbi:MAG: DNA-binding response regulator, partial [Acidobacteriia bacterium 12-62-4]
MSVAGITRLLIVDDDIKYAQLLQAYLEPLGYSIDLVHDGRAGLVAAVNGTYSAIILDVMLPGLNGFDLLRELRTQSAVPVLMLSALGDEPDRVAGLEIGADDYLPKTFSPRELLARLRAVLRRSILTARLEEHARQSPVAVGDLWLDPEARLASLDGKSLKLTSIEFGLLLTLARAAGRIKTREQLLLENADRDFDAFDRS